MAMLSKRGDGLYAPISEINVTPMVDVMLVLLIIFMITAPMLTAGLKVNLPQSKAAQPMNPKAPVVITITKDHVISLGDKIMPLDDLISSIQAKLNGDTGQIIHIRGDRQASYGDIMSVVDLLARNGLTHVGLLSDAHSMSKAAVPSDAALPPAPLEPASTATPTAVPATQISSAPTPTTPANAAGQQ